MFVSHLLGIWVQMFNESNQINLLIKMKLLLKFDDLFVAESDPRTFGMIAAAGSSPPVAVAAIAVTIVVETGNVRIASGID